jgi:hypothetical protein
VQPSAALGRALVRFIQRYVAAILRGSMAAVMSTPCRDTPARV